MKRLAVLTTLVALLAVSSPARADTDKLVADIPDADQGFRLTFSAREFPGYDAKLVWIREDVNGNWYYSEEFQAEGWLCPALFKYFPTAPKEIYVKADAK